MKDAGRAWSGLAPDDRGLTFAERQARPRWVDRQQATGRPRADLKLKVLLALSAAWMVIGILAFAARLAG